MCVLVIVIFQSVCLVGTLGFICRGDHAHAHALGARRAPIDSLSSRTVLWATVDVENGSKTDIKNMKLPELKQYLKLLGGQPGKLRKSEIIEECGRYLESAPSGPVEDGSAAEKETAAKVSSGSATVEVVRKKRVSMQPVPTASLEINEEKESDEPPLKRYRKMTEEERAERDEREERDGDESDYLFKKSTKTKFPVGEARDERLTAEGVLGSDMDLTFLGTASCIPSVTRGVSCVALRYVSDIWMFDCGESSQVQIQKSRVKVSKIRKIFISHLHGDHSFGLAGMLCLIGQATQEENRGQAQEIVDIYGPEGIRDYIRSIVQLTCSRVVAPHRIHELKNVPFLHGSRAPAMAKVVTRMDMNFGEREGSRDIYPDKEGVYHLLDEADLGVRAAPMQHTIPCVGFVVTEKPRSGKLRPEMIREMVERNKQQLSALPGLRGNYMKIYGKLKEMNPGDAFTFPNGEVVHAKDILEPKRDGRKVVSISSLRNRYPDYVQ